MRLAACLACCLPLLAQDAGRLTLDSLFHPTRKVTFVEPAVSRFSWRPDGMLLEERLQKEKLTALMRLDPATWEARPWLSAAQFTAALVAAGANPLEAADAFRGPFNWNPAADSILRY